MNDKIKYYKIRIQLLERRDPIANSRIINKLKRRVRALEALNNSGQE